MTRLQWDLSGQRLFETGVRNCALYPQSSSGTYPTGVAWNGITSITQSPTGADANPLYADDIKYLDLRAAEEEEGTIEAYMYPDEFALCDGSESVASGVMIHQQARKPFGLCYRTVLGNDTELNDHGYKLHIVYGATASPSEKAYETINDSPDAITFSWDYTTVPAAVTGHKPTSSLEIDSTKADEAKLKLLEGILFGVDAPAFSATAKYPAGSFVTYESKVYTNPQAIDTAGAWNASNWVEVENPGPRLPLPDEVISIMAANS